MRERIARLERELEKLRSQRESRRKRRARGATCPCSRSSATPTPARARCSRALTESRRADRRPDVRDARSDLAPAALPARARGDRHRHGGLHPRPAARSGRRLPRHARGAARRRPAAARGRRRGARASSAASTRCARCSTRSASAITPELLVFNQIDRLPPGVGEAIARATAASRSRRSAARGSRELLAARRADALASRSDRERYEPPAAALAAQGGGLSA